MFRVVIPVRAARAAGWSGAMTAFLAQRTPGGARPAVLAAVKAIHTAIFAAVAVQIGVVVWDGLRQRPGLRTAAALAIVLGESAVYASNNQVCPLTPLAEALGAPWIGCRHLPARCRQPAHPAGRGKRPRSGARAQPSGMDATPDATVKRRGSTTPMAWATAPASGWATASGWARASGSAWAAAARRGVPRYRPGSA